MHEVFFMHKKNFTVYSQLAVYTWKHSHLTVILAEWLTDFKPSSTGYFTRTFSPHAIFEALLEAAVLALIAMVLIHRAVFTPPALVGQVPAHWPLEEALTTWERVKKCFNKIKETRRGGWRWGPG
jgi:hypothetical protein